MNENLISLFFNNGNDKNVIECIILFIKSLIETINDVDNDNAIEVYIIDNINNNVYHNKQIEDFCLLFKQQLLFRRLQINNQSCNNKTIENKSYCENDMKENKYIKPITK